MVCGECHPRRWAWCWKPTWWKTTTRSIRNVGVGCRNLATREATAAGRRGREGGMCPYMATSICFLIGAVATNKMPGAMPRAARGINQLCSLPGSGRLQPCTLHPPRRRRPARREGRSEQYLWKVQSPTVLTRCAHHWACRIIHRPVSRNSRLLTSSDPGV